MSLMAAAAKDADISREVGFRWTPAGLETLYFRSRVVLAARAAGLNHVVLGLWQSIKELDGLRAFAQSNRDVGYGGQVVIHPSHVSIVNDAYSPSENELERFASMVAAYEAGSSEGAWRRHVRGRAHRSGPRAARQASTGNGYSIRGEPVMSGMYFEEFVEGAVFKHAMTRTVTETDNLLFTSLTMNPQPLHLDEEFAKASMYGQRIVNSVFTLGLVAGIHGAGAPWERPWGTWASRTSSSPSRCSSGTPCASNQRSSPYALQTAGRTLALSNSSIEPSTSAMKSCASCAVRR